MRRYRNRNDLICEVLTYLAEHGDARIYSSVLQGAEITFKQWGQIKRYVLNPGLVEELRREDGLLKTVRITEKGRIYLEKQRELNDMIGIGNNEVATVVY